MSLPVSEIRGQMFGSTAQSGSSAFEYDTTSVATMDLYYVMHASNYSTNIMDRIVTISDRYDFALGDYNGIAGAAIDTMYMAQAYGAIVPFMLIVTV